MGRRRHHCLSRPHLGRLARIVGRAEMLIQGGRCQGLSRLIEQCEGSRSIVARISYLLSTSCLFPAPRGATRASESRLVRTLGSACFVRGGNSQLVSVEPRRTIPIRQVLTVCAFVRSICSGRGPRDGRRHPSPRRIQSSIQVLSFRQGRDSV